MDFSHETVRLYGEDPLRIQDLLHRRRSPGISRPPHGEDYLCITGVDFGSCISTLYRESSACVIIFVLIECFPLVFSPRLALVIPVFIVCQPPNVKDPLIRVPPCIMAQGEKQGKRVSTSL